MEMERIREFIAKEVSDWDDEVAARARFKDFSGQRSDWQPIFGFWRDLILNIALHFDILFFRPSQVKKDWFNRGGLSPLCLDQVLMVMREEGDIIGRRELVDPIRSKDGSLSLAGIYRKVRSLMGTARGEEDEEMVVMAVLKERASRAVERLAETHWTESAIVTMPSYHQICGGGPDQASAVLSYLCSLRRARYLSLNTVQGVKVSLSASPLSGVSSLDTDVLHLIWTTEMLQQQLSLVDTRSEKSRKEALASLSSGNKNVALRHLRTFKLANASREKCESLLNRVEEVLDVIANADTTKKVSEAIQIGAQAIKENKISVEDFEHSLQELEESIDLQKQVENALESTASYTLVEDEDIEEEFKKLELEVEGGNHDRLIPKAEPESMAGKREDSESADSLSDAFSKLKMANGPSSIQEVITWLPKKTKDFELEAA